MAAAIDAVGDVLAARLRAPRMPLVGIEYSILHEAPAFNDLLEAFLHSAPARSA